MHSYQLQMSAGLKLVCLFSVDEADTVRTSGQSQSGSWSISPTGHSWRALDAICCHIESFPLTLLSTNRRTLHYTQYLSGSLWKMECRYVRWPHQSPCDLVCTYCLLQWPVEKLVNCLVSVVTLTRTSRTFPSLFPRHAIIICSLTVQSLVPSVTICSKSNQIGSRAEWTKAADAFMSSK